jgi:hypothetical protein
MEAEPIDVEAYVKEGVGGLISFMVWWQMNRMETGEAYAIYPEKLCRRDWDYLFASFCPVAPHNESWCYHQGGPYTIKGVSDRAFLNGCPVCGEKCCEKATTEQKVEAAAYFATRHIIT